MKQIKLQKTPARAWKCEFCGYTCPYEGEEGKVICPVCRINYMKERELKIVPTSLHVR